MFQLWEINQMEQEMCQYLDWEPLKEFDAMVCKDVARPGPYPTYVPNRREVSTGQAGGRPHICATVTVAAEYAVPELQLQL
jgi:hypothetical protein